jgi:hypothetical protein
VTKPSKDKDSYSLLSSYISLYRNKYGNSPIVNKYKEKWAMSSLIEDFGISSVQDTLNYYFKLNKEGHSLSWFFNNFSTIHSSRLSAERDAMIRQEQRVRTMEIRAEFINGVS